MPYKQKGFPKHQTKSHLNQNEDNVDYSKFNANMELTDEQKDRTRELAGQEKIDGQWVGHYNMPNTVVAGSGPGMFDAGKKLIQGGKWLYDELTN